MKKIIIGVLMLLCLSGCGIEWLWTGDGSGFGPTKRWTTNEGMTEEQRAKDPRWWINPNARQ